MEFHQNDISMPLGVIDGWYAKLERIWNLKLDAWFPNRERGHLTVAVLRVKDETEYSILKRAADLRYGRHLICMQLGKVNAAAERKEEYLSNICMKINMKGKGVNHKVKFDQIGWKSKETMILGADVTHPSVLQPRGYPSIACVVGSIDDNFANYPGSMRLQAGRQEVCN